MTMTSSALIAELDNPFWRFSISVYQNKEVKNACLALQNNHQANVNLLLLCCWLACAVEEVSEKELQQACQTVESWHKNVTEVLRNTRHWVKSHGNKEKWLDDYYQQVLRDEIISETRQQYLLFSCFQSRLKAQFSKNEERAIGYLTWLFADMKLIINQQLETDITRLVTLIFSMVNNHEAQKTHNRH